MILGEGVIDLDQNLPDREVALVAPAAMLVADRHFHPALVVLLLQIASATHQGEMLFENAGPFPTSRYVDASLPLSVDAQHYYAMGPSVLQRYLPFWAATLIDRLKIMLLPLATLFLPLVKLGPPIYIWRTRVKIYRWYRVLRDIDQRHTGGGARKARRQDLTRLGKLEQELNDVTVPLSYMAEFYDLRLHIEHVRRKLERQ